MNTKNLTKISIIAISVLLIVALGLVLIITPNNINNSNGTNIATTNATIGGFYGEHGKPTTVVDRTQAENSALNEFEVDPNNQSIWLNSNFAWITTGAELVSFLNSTKKIGYLANDVTLNTTINGGVTSGRTFDTTRVLDGNGYKVNIDGGSGGTATFSQSAGSVNSYFEDNANTNEIKGTGYLTGINKGTIRNVNINYSSNLGINPTANTFMTGTNKISGTANESHIKGVGIVAGVNMGNIVNVSLNVNSPFTYLNESNTSNTFNNQTLYMGGVAGLAMGNSKISKVSVTNAGGIGAISRNGNALNSVGGVLGGIAKGNAKLEYISLSGQGGVQASASTGNTDVSEPGGVLGSTYAPYNGTSIATLQSNHLQNLNTNQVIGIISNYRGTALRSRGGSNVGSQPKNGVLFGTIGSSGISHALFLYDYLNYNEVSKDNTHADFRNTQASPSLEPKFTNWTQAFSSGTTSNKGTVKGAFNYNNTSIPVKIVVVADGYKADTDQSYRNPYTENVSGIREFFRVSDEYAGGIIWKVTLDGNESSPHVSVDKEILGAEVYNVQSSANTSMNVIFGEAYRLTFDNNNTEKQYNGLKLDRPQARLSSDISSVSIPTINTNNTTNLQYNVSAKFDIDPTEFPVSYTSGGVYSENLDNTKLPGSYLFKPFYELGQAKTKISYYNGSELALVMPGATETYRKTVAKSGLSVSGNITNNWIKELNINIALQGNSESGMHDKLIVNENGINKEISTGGVSTYNYKDSQSTGPNGKNITLSLYKTFNYIKSDGTTGNHPVLVSDKYTIVDVKIDSTAPQIQNIKYYDYSNNIQGEELTQVQRDNWRSGKVLVKYDVVDNESGVRDISFQNVDYTSIVTEQSGGVVYRLSASMVLSNNLPIALTYPDEASNSVQGVSVSSKIDTVAPKINVLTVRPSLETEPYVTDANNNRYIGQVRVQVNANVGSSKAKLMYSTNNSVWKDWIDDVVAGSTYRMTWEMDTATELRVKIVSKSGIYEDSLYQHPGVDINGDSWALGVFPSPLNAMIGSQDGKWIMLLKEAVITVDWNSIKVGTSTMAGITAGLLNSGFKREYDGTKNAIYKTNTAGWSVDLTKVTIQSTKLDINGGIVPITNADLINANLNIILNRTMRDSNVGANEVYITASLSAQDSLKYIIKFKNLDSTTEVDKITVATTIDPKILNVNMATMSSVKKQYSYGDIIDSGFDVAGVNGEVLRFNNVTEAKYKSNVGTYPLTATPSNTYNNYTINITPTTLNITPKQVEVTFKLDGKEMSNSSRPYNALASTVTATYLNIDNVVTAVNVAIKKQNSQGVYETATQIKAIGKYQFALTIADTNYAVSGDDAKDFEIVKIPLPIKTGTYVTDYENKAIVYEVEVEMEPGAKKSELYSDTEYTVNYYKYITYSKNEKGVYEFGNYNTASIHKDDVKNIGAYRVEVVFVGNQYFDDVTVISNIVIEKAHTTIDAKDYVVDYSGASFTYDPFVREIQVIGANKKNVVLSKTSGQGAYDSNITMQVFDPKEGITGKFVDVNPENINKMNAGDYRFKIIYKDNANYYGSEQEVTLTINKINFTGIRFDNKEVVYDNKIHTFEETSTNVYPGVKIEYIHRGITYTKAEFKDQFKFKDVGEYTVSVRYSMDNYNTYSTEAVLKIKNAPLKNIIASDVETDYDGQEKNVTISGLTYRDGKYYYEGIEAMVTERNTKGTNAGTYKGSYTIMVKNYETLVLDTILTITPAQVEVEYLLNNINSNTNFLENFAKYKPIGAENEVECQLFFINIATGEAVEPDENGKLPAGKYQATIAFPDTNYATTKTVEFTVGKTGMSVGLIAGIAGGAVAVVGVAVVLITVIKKKKG